ncbi:PQQ-dependent sugar dehydrogenase [Gallaecimonas kandeliae]|uniref:PQQ-dependent sugar dehydrogenase n=1 Tax=Gallaecimonas kandeliae TaxID=3029055 RepID=UPI00264790CE|nr:PQQ-dependent sugar dehydrogenase [Gallaecimonas kandeliae]WKE65208.1 PQQ-dependent sugar dehydrogenase [Gallaecimonas kandeliae]
MKALALLLLLPALALAQPKVELEVLASGLEHPWALAFLPDGRQLVSERPGRLRIIDKGKVGPPIQGLPKVAAVGQGGLLDIALHGGWLYFSYAEPGPRGANGTAVARAHLRGGRLTDREVIFRQIPKVRSSAHFGSRLAFAPDGRLFITLGERYSRRNEAQNLANSLGKVVRLEPDGSVPADNPFAGHKGVRPEIWSFGHRNVQGAAINPWTGQLWTHEHGPQGGDELNIDLPGRNYGWPIITYGEEYGGGKIGEGSVKAGMEQPIYHWTPSIAPSGMAFYTGDAFPAWKGSLFIGSLKFGYLVRLALEGDQVLAEERLFGKEIGQRVRDVRQGPDGLLYLLTDEDDGRLLRLRPATTAGGRPSPAPAGSGDRAGSGR